MEINPLTTLSFSWILGVLIGTQIAFWPPELPTLFTILGFVLLGGMSSIFYFGKLAGVFLLMLGILESYLVKAYPVAGILLGICTIGAGLYGKIVGDLALEDFYEHGQTRLPGLSVAAFLNLLLILAFAILVWYLFPILPSAGQLAQWLPLSGLGV